MSGPMGAGKTYYGKLYVKKHPGSVRISRDDIRFSYLAPGDDYFSKEKEVLKEFYGRAQEAINDPNVKAVILDASHLDDMAIAKTLSHLAIPKGIKVIQVRVCTNLDTCLRQNATREGRAKVPDEVIKRAYEQFNVNKQIGWVRKRIDEVWMV